MNGVFIFNAVMSIYITFNLYHAKESYMFFQQHMLIADGFKTLGVIET